eukprot:6202976-Pleurochrysis_carterae.AAC.3
MKRKRLPDLTYKSGTELLRNTTDKAKQLIETCRIVWHGQLLAQEGTILLLAAKYDIQTFYLGVFIAKQSAIRQRQTAKAATCLGKCILGY